MGCMKMQMHPYIYMYIYCASEIFANKTRVVYINAYILCRNVEGYDANNANDFKRIR